MRDTEIGYKLNVSSEVQNYILVCVREQCSTKPPKIYVYIDLAAYAVLTNYGDPSNFREVVASQKKDN